MTTETDLIAMARECGFLHSNPTGGHVSIDQLATFRAAILADAAQGVEPVAQVTRFHDLGGEIDWTQRVILPVGAKVYSAATVAGLQARIAELEAQLLAAQKDLNDAATSLHTISTLAGRSTYGSPPIESNLGTFQEVRAYANSRHQAAIARSKA